MTPEETAGPCAWGQVDRTLIQNMQVEHDRLRRDFTEAVRLLETKLDRLLALFASRLPNWATLGIAGMSATIAVLATLLAGKL